MWKLTKSISLAWNVSHEDEDAAAAKWLVENRPQLWKEVVQGYDKYGDAEAILKKVRQALAEKASNDLE